MQSWCRIYPLNGSRHIRAKQKTSQESQRSLQKFLEPDGNPKVIYTDNSLNSAKLVKIFPGIIARPTPHRSETNGIAERAVHRVKEGTLKIGGQMVMADFGQTDLANPFG